MGSYFLVADVLGFSKIVLNLSHDDLDERMQCWTGLVAKARCEAHIDRIQLISDTVFVQVDDTDHGLEQLLIFSKLLLEYGIEQSFPIRGAISRGNVTWGEFTYGRAVIEGHSLERSQDWIGIACMNGLDVPWSWDLVCAYPLPRKSGSFKIFPVVSWTMDQRQTLLQKITGQGLMQDGEHFTWEIYSKVKNTSNFLTYVERARTKDRDPKTYYSELGLL